jgi:hypothetical protein
MPRHQWPGEVQRVGEHDDGARRRHRGGELVRELRPRRDLVGVEEYLLGHERAAQRLVQRERVRPRGGPRIGEEDVVTHGVPLEA